jgi:hypothetical protein
VRPAELAQQAKQQVAELTGLDGGAVTGLDRNGDAWVVTVDVTELERIPNTMDVIGTFEVKLSEDGEVLGLRRTGRHRRSETDHGRG